jgi:hypothetical protein
VSGCQCSRLLHHCHEYCISSEVIASIGADSTATPALAGESARTHASSTSKMPADQIRSDNPNPDLNAVMQVGPLPAHPQQQRVGLERGAPLLPQHRWPLLTPDESGLCPQPAVPSARQVLTPCPAWPAVVTQEGTIGGIPLGGLVYQAWGQVFMAFRFSVF